MVKHNQDIHQNRSIKSLKLLLLIFSLLSLLQITNLTPNLQIIKFPIRDLSVTYPKLRPNWYPFNELRGHGQKVHILSRLRLRRRLPPPLLLTELYDFPSILRRNVFYS